MSHGYLHTLLLEKQRNRFVHTIVYTVRRIFSGAARFPETWKQGDGEQAFLEE
jgi:hypothetical protein